jgi:signal transduction histidine kinase
LQHRSTPEDVVRYEYLCNVELSCTTALDTLNDLLAFEKLESGILDLHKEEINANGFIADCMQMFSSQATANKIALKVRQFDSSLVPNPANTDTGALHYSKAVPPEVYDSKTVPLEAYDTIPVDKFKMAQVVRNLVSNAIKFTPAGGSVTVTPSFIPMPIDEHGANRVKKGKRSVASAMESSVMRVLNRSRITGNGSHYCLYSSSL